MDLLSTGDVTVTAIVIVIVPVILIKNIDLFRQKFEKQKDSKKGECLFIGYQFPEELFFSGKFPKQIESKFHQEAFSCYSLKLFSHL